MRNVSISVSAFVCGPVGKITIDFFFVSVQPGLSGPFDQ